MIRTLTPLFSIIIAIAVFFMYVQPTYEDIGELQDEKNEYTQAIEKASEFNALLEQYISRKNSFSVAEIERLEALVPDRINEVKILVDIQAIADSHGIILGNVSVTDEGESDRGAEDTSPNSITPEDFITSEISFDIIATYDQLKSFMADIEQSLVLLELQNFSFEVLEGDLQQYSFTINAFALTPFSEG